MKKIKIIFLGILSLPSLASGKGFLELHLPSSQDFIKPQQDLEKEVFRFTIRGREDPVSISSLVFRQVYEFSDKHFQFFWAEVGDRPTQMGQMSQHNLVRLHFRSPLVLLPGESYPVKLYTRFSSPRSRSLPTQFILQDISSDADYEAIVHYPRPLKSLETDVFENMMDYTVYQMRDKDLPVTSLVIMNQGEILWMQEVFSTSYDIPLLLEHPRIYRWASISKLFTAISISQLKEKGFLDLDVPISRYLPEYAETEIFQKITLRHLLSHHSGLAREPSVGHYYQEKPYSLSQIVKDLAHKDILDFGEPPTRGWWYSNAAFALAGHIVEKVTGDSFEDYVEAHIFEPLQMENSAFSLENLNRKNFVRGYMWAYDRAPYAAPVFDFGISPAVNLYASVEDIGRFLQENVSESQKIMSFESWNAMWVPQFARRKITYGLGYYLSLFAGEKKVGHMGQVHGYASRFWVVPRYGMGVAVNAALEKANQPVDDMSNHALRLLWAMNEGKSLPRAEIFEEIMLKDGFELSGTYFRGKSFFRIFKKEDRYYLDDTYRIVRLKQKEPFQYVTDGRLDRGEKITLQADGGIIFRGRRYEKKDPDFPLVPERYADLIGKYGPPFANIEIKWDGQDMIYFEDFYSYTMYPTKKIDQFIFRNGELLRVLRDHKGKVRGIEAAHIPFEKR